MADPTLPQLEDAMNGALLDSLAKQPKGNGATEAIAPAPGPEAAGPPARRDEAARGSSTFLGEARAIRARARRSLEDGAVTANYRGSVEEAIDLLNHAVASEIVCVLRYKFHAATATGLASEAVRAEFTEHAADEARHLDLLVARIAQLGGKPDLSPEGLSARAGTDYVEGRNLTEMIKENLIAERIAVETYRELVRYFGEDDPTTRVMLEGILADEEGHANDMRDLLAGGESRPAPGK